MIVPFLDLPSQYEAMSIEVDAAIASVLRQGIFIGGKSVADFNDNFSQYLGVAHCVACGNATDGLEIALRALDVGPGDEVLVPELTQISAAEAVTVVGATPVFIDVHPEYYTIDSAKIKAKITAKTKAIIPVHLYGLPASMDDIMALASSYDLAVIEDCAQAHGACYKGKKVGTIGDIGVFSFYPTKNLGAIGDGGAMVTNDPKLAEACQLIANHGQSKKDVHIRLGKNSRLDTLQAAILSIKLPHLDGWNRRRQQVAVLYHKLLADTPMQLPVTPEYADHVYHLYVIQTAERDALRVHLKRNGITTIVHYPYTLSSTGIFTSNHRSNAPTTAGDLTNKILSLPIFPGISDEQVEWVASNIIVFYATR